MDQWNKYSVLYNKGIGNFGDNLHSELIDPVIEENINFKKTNLVIDLGCGNGYLERKYSSKVGSILGLDGSAKLLEFAKKNASHNANFLRADLTKKFPINEKYADIALCIMTLQYLPDIKNFVNEASRILKPNGRLLIIIDHPAHALFLRAQELAGLKNGKFLDSDSYFVEGLRTKKSLWNKVVLSYYHRPVGYYINEFTQKFHLVKIVEKGEGEIPRILAILFKKEGF